MLKKLLQSQKFQVFFNDCKNNATTTTKEEKKKFYSYFKSGRVAPMRNVSTAQEQQQQQK